MKGMTLVETLITISIFITIMVAVGTFEASVFSYQRSVSGSLETSTNAQAIFKTIMKEIRAMSPSATGTYPIVTAATNTISFFSDINNDGSQEQVTYSLMGNTVYKAVIVPTGSPLSYSLANQSTTSLVSNVRNSSSTPLLEYFDNTYNGSGSSLTQPVTLSAISLIRMNLTLDVDPNKSPTPVTYSANMSLRNLKTNL